MIASLFLATSVANASPIQSDLDLAFGGAVKTQQVTLLNDTQMSDIKGKGWGRSFRRAFKRTTRRFGKAVRWNKYRYTYIKYGIIFGAYSMGYPITYDSMGNTIIHF